MNEDLIAKVRNFADNKHEHPGDAQRYGSAPYLFHLESVANYARKYIHLLNTDMQCEIMICASYLHDCIEDTDMDIKSIKSFLTSLNIISEDEASEIAELVYRVSNERGRTRKEKNFKTYPKIWNSKLATFLKICDRLANTKNSKETGHRMYETYKDEYPVFKYALREKENDPFEPMWQELELLSINLSFGEKTTCPCHYLENPCQPQCSCKNPLSSHGCYYCFSYGSDDQKNNREKCWIIRNSEGNIVWTQKTMSDKQLIDYRNKGLYIEEHVLLD